jgi:type I restriction enzyme S subunit
MELRTGYKQTDAGIIPEDWESAEIGTLEPFITSGSRGWAVHYAEYGSTFLRITNMSRNSIYVDRSDLKFVKLPQQSSEGVRTQLRIGDLLVSITADIGIVSFVDSSIPAPAYINQHIALVRFDENKANSKFLCYFLASESSQRAFRASTDNGAKAGMNLAEVRRIKAVFPPLFEQQAISATLSNMDALLSALDAGLAKKRDIKQATMEELLTAQRRLPGFIGEWDKKRLGDLARIQRGASPRPIENPVWFDQSSSIGWVRISDVTRSGMFLCETSQKLSSIGVQHSRPVDAGGLIMSICATVGRPIILMIDVCIHDGFVVFDNLKANKLFIYYFLKWIEPDWSKHGQTGSQMNLNTGLINGIEIMLPQIDEQNAIAQALSDMDADITALTERRDKTRAIKQAMMQELLTGRIRLV